MESTLCLQYPKPNTHHCLSSIRDTTRATRRHIGFRHPSLFLSNGYPLGLGLVLHPVTHNPDGLSRSSSTYKKGNNKTSARGTRATLYPFGGRNSLKSLLNVTVYLATNEIPQFSCPPPRVKLEAMKMMKSGKSDEALNMMKKAYKDSKDDYLIGMALVEILITQGKYKEALNYNCLKEGQGIFADGRVPLYKAIIFTMLNEMKTAEKWWKEYTDIIAEGYDIDVCKAYIIGVSNPTDSFPKFTVSVALQEGT